MSAFVPIADVGTDAPGTLPREQAASARTSALGFREVTAVGLWCSFFLTSPFYIVRSGLPQLSDLIMVALLGALLLFGRFEVPRWSFRAVNAVTLFVLYVFTVDMIWLVITGDTGFLFTASYFVYNLMVCLAFLSLYHWLGRPFLQWTAGAVCISLLLQGALSFFYRQGGHGREILFFDNPNQLGYYAVLYGSIFWVWADSRASRRTRPLLGSLCVYALALYLSVLSLSRAAIVSSGLLLMLAGLKSPKLLAATALLALAALFGGAQWEQQRAAGNRFESRSRGSVTAELVGRGYDRILRYPQYLLLGAGEGRPSRFSLPGSKEQYELHSSLATVLFCYGIAGMFLFLHIFVILGRQCGLFSLVYLLPVLLYGMTHMGLRQSEFWVLMMLLLCVRWGSDRIAAGKPCAIDRQGRPPDEPGSTTAPVMSEAR